MPGFLLLQKALLLISAQAQHVSPVVTCWALWPKFPFLVKNKQGRERRQQNFKKTKPKCFWSYKVTIQNVGIFNYEPVSLRIKLLWVWFCSWHDLSFFIHFVQEEIRHWASPLAFQHTQTSPWRTERTTQDPDVWKTLLQASATCNLYAYRAWTDLPQDNCIEPKCPSNRLNSSPKWKDRCIHKENQLPYEQYEW